MRKISFKKIFNFISLVFLLSCVLFYSYRFITLYLDNNKKESVKTFADVIKSNNSGNNNFKNVKGDYYFYGKDVNNYVKYSNFVWRIIKVDKSGSVIVSLDSNISALAKGNNEFKKSNIYEWLNKSGDLSGVFESVLNDTSLYLSDTDSCIDKVSDIKNITCKDKLKDTLISIPSLNDYVNTGGSKSFLNNGQYYHLVNSGDSYCIDNSGKVGKAEDGVIAGIKPVITFKKTVQLNSGEGTVSKPYEIDDYSSLIGGYVKIGEDIWRVYGEDGDNVKLVLDSYLKVNNLEVESKYSKSSYVFNVQEVGCLAYYLNGKYLNSLVYKNILEDFDLSNGIYTNDYKENVKSKVKVKVGIMRDRKSVV